MKHRPIPIERAKRLLSYDTSSPSGLVWRQTRGAARKGAPAGCYMPTGYISVGIDGTLYYAHRLVYAIVTGTDPGEKHIDHIDGSRTNNNVLNLRAVAPADNARNTRSQRGTSKYLGVSWNKRNNKWLAQIKRDRKLHSLGSYDLEEDAARAYDAAARELHPGGRLNFPLPTDLNQTPAHNEHCHRDRPHSGPPRTGTAGR